MNTDLTVLSLIKFGLYFNYHNKVTNKIYYFKQDHKDQEDAQEQQEEQEIEEPKDKSDQEEHQDQQETQEYQEHKDHQEPFVLLLRILEPVGSLYELTLDICFRFIDNAFFIIENHYCILWNIPPI